MSNYNYNKTYFEVEQNLKDEEFSWETGYKNGKGSNGAAAKAILAGCVGSLMFCFGVMWANGAFTFNSSELQTNVGASAGAKSFLQSSEPNRPKRAPSDTYDAEDIWDNVSARADVRKGKITVLQGASPDKQLVENEDMHFRELIINKHKYLLAKKTDHNKGLRKWLSIFQNPKYRILIFVALFLMSIWVAGLIFFPGIIYKSFWAFAKWDLVEMAAGFICIGICRDFEKGSLQEYYLVKNEHAKDTGKEEPCCVCCSWPYIICCVEGFEVQELGYTSYCQCVVPYTHSLTTERQHLIPVTPDMTWGDVVKIVDDAKAEKKASTGDQHVEETEPPAKQETESDISTQTESKAEPARDDGKKCVCRYGEKCRYLTGETKRKCDYDHTPWQKSEGTLICPEAAS